MAQRIVDNLDVLRKKEQHDGNVFKARAYIKAIAAIRAAPGPITTVADVDGLPGVGKKIREKIAEILSTGTLAAADAARADAVRADAADSLADVYGIGAVKARALAKAGIKCVAELRAAYAADATLLNDKQVIGLAYYEDLLQRIPRAEVRRHEAHLRAVFDAAGAEAVEVVGSYRRGAADSGDVDVLVRMPPRAFAEAIHTLRDTGYMVETLAEGAKKFMGIARLPGGGAPRRVDILLTPAAEYAFAILYFTGSQDFNVAMRKRALERGVSLNEHGFTPRPARAFATEKDIFDFLEMPYVPPTER